MIAPITVGSCHEKRFARPSFAAISTLPAYAQDKRSWSTFDTDTGAVLGFGVPETDDTVITFTCDKGNPNVLVSSRIGSKGLKADEAAKIILTAGKGEEGIRRQGHHQSGKRFGGRGCRGKLRTSKPCSRAASP